MKRFSITTLILLAFILGGVHHAPSGVLTLGAPRAEAFQAPTYAKYKFVGGKYTFKGGKSLFNRTANTAPVTTYIENVFSSYVYSGAGTTQTITNSINLSGLGGLVWIKQRNGTFLHILQDTLRGVHYFLQSQATDASGNDVGAMSSFNTNGFTLPFWPHTNNNSTETYVSWSFARAPKFFDVVTYTGNGTTKTISHSLGIQPGMILIKRTTGVAIQWYIWHRSTTSGYYMDGFSTAAQTNVAAASVFGNGSITVDPTSTQFTVGGANGVNSNGDTFVAYLFAHDPSPTGLVQCNSFLTDGSGNATVTLGWEPQYIMYKGMDVITNWNVLDTSRLWNVAGTDETLLPDSSNALDSTTDLGYPTTTGFVAKNLSASKNFIYCAVRRGPMQYPATGTQVYNAIARTGTGTTATVSGVGFPLDTVWEMDRGGTTAMTAWDRLRGIVPLATNSTGAEQTGYSNGIQYYTMDGYTVGSNMPNPAQPVINWFFRRYPGVFDVVAYTGTGSIMTVAHNLGVAPELVIVKSRSGVMSWVVNHSSLVAAAGYLSLDSTSAVVNGATTMWNNTAPTATQLTIGTNGSVNTNASTYVAYLFASKPNISKVGSYTGNGSTQNINANFSASARFVMIKRTDSTGDWYVWDSTRGINASANDPHMSLNTAAAEVTTDDSIDPYTTSSASGFTVKQNVTTNVNVLNATYIYLAFQ
jgi:hypothetical protein